MTWTCTFNGRLEAFFDVLTSFLREASPRSQRRVRDWVVVADRGATVDHRLAIMSFSGVLSRLSRARPYRAPTRYRAPWLTFVGKGAALHRHPVSLNLLAESFVKTRFWCQWEDDWAVAAGSARAAGGDLLQRAIDVRRATGCHQVSMNGFFAGVFFVVFARVLFVDGDPP